MRVSPSFLRTTAVKKPRTEWGCQPVAFMIVAIVVPRGSLSKASTASCLVPIRFEAEGMRPGFADLFERGQKWFHDTANFLEHADRDPDAILQPNNLPDNDLHIGFCIILYRDLKEKFTPAMAAFHHWMVIRHPDEFMIAEDEDREFEQAHRQAMASLDRPAEIFMLDALLKVYKDGVIPPDIGFRRRPKH